MRITQSDSYQGDDWWEWAVWIDGTPEELSRIEAVTYTLHPSFSPPVVRTTDRGSMFRLASSGWGEFSLSAKVVFQDGASKTLKHDLKLHYPDTEKRAQALIRVAMPPSGQPELPHSLMSLKSAILDAAPNTDVAMVKTPPTKGPGGPIPPGEALSVDLTGSAAAALARGIQSWLTRNTGVELELVTDEGRDEGKRVIGITPDNIVSILQSAMTMMRK